jgi:hypothetical protein
MKTLLAIIATLFVFTVPAQASAEKNIEPKKGSCYLKGEKVTVLKSVSETGDFLEVITAKKKALKVYIEDLDCMANATVGDDIIAVPTYFQGEYCATKEKDIFTKKPCHRRNSAYSIEERSIGYSDYVKHEYRTCELTEVEPWAHGVNVKADCKTPGESTVFPTMFVLEYDNYAKPSRNKLAISRNLIRH